MQVVRPGEVGSTDLIRESAAKAGSEVREFELEAQFRSNGSDSFIKWVDNTLEMDRRRRSSGRPTTTSTSASSARSRSSTR